MQLTRRTFGSIATATATAGVVAGTTAGCSSNDKGSAPAAMDANNQQAPSSAPSTKTSAALPVATLSTPQGLHAMLPTDSLSISVSNGTLAGMEVATADGKAVAGTLTTTTWKPTRYLLPNTKYVATLHLKDDDGTAHTQKVDFRTLETTVADFDILYTGNTVGVGLPAIIQFASAVIGKDRKAEVQKHVGIEVNPPQAGSWGWLSDTQLMWRPESYWKPGTKVTVKADLAGVQTGPHKWVNHDATGSFTIGAARISYVDIVNHVMRVTENGKTVRTIPVTTGRPPTYSTRSGTKVIIERLSSTIMDSSTVDIPKGSPDAYHLDVKWAMRLTYSGEFIHAAPWSVGSQGYANVSHGCTGMSTENAHWMFNFSRVGDVVIYTGSSRPMTTTNGYGMWNLTYPQWKATSAL